MLPALYLIPVTLGETPIEQVLPSYNHEVIMGIRHFIVEEIRSARRFLRKTDREFPIDDCTFYEMGKHADEKQFSAYLQPLREGKPVGVISEAGCPAVADPGADIVRIAQREGLRVVPLVGPNSMIMAVMSSGLGGQSFAFNGYLPVEPSDRAKRLKALESRAWTEGQTQLFIETPFRNQKMFQSLLSTLRPQTRLCIAAGITTADEYIRTLRISEWKKEELPLKGAGGADLSKVPAIFLINK
ncbi:MAG: SAM-dependent methyltransferase [Bacteroidaceae bacterium]|nr:SAM-dependent methyltransferase [Bacteroidaceae bacterium]